MKNNDTRGRHGGLDARASSFRTSNRNGAEEEGVQEELPESFDLRKSFPMSHRWPFKKSFGVFAAFVGVTVGVSVIDYYFASHIQDDFHRGSVQLVLASAVVFTFLMWTARLLIYEFERAYFDYRVVEGYFYLSKGVFIKQKGSFPLSRITDIYLYRSFSDFLFGLYNLEVSTPTASSGEFAHIFGLREKNAVALQRQISELVQKNDFHLENIDHYMNTLPAASNRRLANRARRTSPNEV